VSETPDPSAAVYEAPLPPEEFERRLREAIASAHGPEGEEMRALVDWFVRRYPTPLARLEYARRKTREALRFRGLALGARRVR
jgi:hypothetical protein